MPTTPDEAFVDVQCMDARIMLMTLNCIINCYLAADNTFVIELAG